jgi:hypothetical protein
MMGKAGTLSHDPAPDWPCYTERGEAGAGSSNLALGSYGPSAIAGYMRDPGPNNAAVGHRRWILYPRTELFGTGDVPGGSGAYGANALRVFGEPYSDPQPATRDGFVAWPPPGYVPYQVTYPRWSFSYPGADFSGASVTVSTAGQPVALAIESAVSPSYGNNTIVWRMDNLGDWSYWPAPSSDKPYQVTVSNVVINGAPQTFTYEVIVIDPADDGRPDPSVTLNTDRTTVNNWVTFSIIGYPPNSPVQITWRRLSGSRINIDTVQTDGTGAAAGRFRVPATPGGPNQQIAFTSGSTTQTLLFEVAPRIKVLTNPAVRGDEVNISLRGYAKQEAVRIRWRNPADGKWVELARITTSNTGSANVLVTVPAWAPDGNNSVRGDGTVFRQQTNTVAVSGGPFQPASEASPTPSPTATPTGTPTVTETPVETATSTPELTETPAVTETPVETETPAETETATPTETPVETVTAEPTETATDEPTAAP